MALTRIKTWIAGETLSAADLNAEFDNFITNGAGSLSSPRTSAFDMDALALILDADADTYFQASNDDIVDLYGQTVVLVRFDLSVASPVNGFGLTASATGVGVDFITRGSDTNIGLRIQPKGSGKVTIDGGFNYVAAGGTVDAITATYSPAVTALDDGLSLSFMASGANLTTTPTFAPNGLTAKTIVKINATALGAGDIAGSSHICTVRYSSSTDKWHLQNPSFATADLFALTTDNSNCGATDDFVPWVDVSASNVALKATWQSHLYNLYNNFSADTTPDVAADYVLTRDVSAVNMKKVLIKHIGIGAQTVWIPAAAMTARTTNGAAAGSTESSSNKVMCRTLDFDASTAEYAQFTVAFPKGWNLGTVTAQFFWRATNTGNCIWALQGVAISDDDVVDAAFGTQQSVTDGVTATTDVMVSAATAAITLAGTPVAGDICVFQVFRDATNGSDTLAVDALLLGVKLIYTIDASTDD